MANSDEFNDVDLISNTIYIYLILIFVYLVVGLIFYASREYYISLKFRPNSITDEKVGEWESTPNVQEPEVVSGTYGTLDLEDMGSLNKSFTPKISIINKEPDTPIDSISDEDLPQSFRKLDIIYDEINSGEVASITRMMKQDTKAKSKTVYGLKQLNEIKDTIQTYKTNPGQNILEILKFSYSIPKTEFCDIYENNKLINQIKEELISNENDTVTKSIILLNLVSLGVDDNNSNYFIYSFNELLEFSVDTGLLFRLIEQSTISSLEILVIEMLLNYCWNQWIAGGTRRRGTIQPRPTIFRILCNTELGVSSIENLAANVRNKLEFKSQALIREIVTNSYCNDYLEFIPMMSQAIDLAQSNNIKFLFYDILFLIIKKHSQCCMEDYLNDYFTDLKLTIQHGFWFKHDTKIIHKTNEIFKYLIDQKFSNVYNWLEEINGGKIFVCSGKSSGKVRTKHQNGSQIYVNDVTTPKTPGGLKLFK